MDEVPCKVIVVGNSGVGKTSIILRYVKDQFQQNVAATIGGNYASKILEMEDFNVNLELNIWDTAGQEKYRGVGKMFYNDANIAILVYDITTRESFDEIKNYWYNEIKDCASNDISKFIIFYFQFSFWDCWK